MLENLLEEIAKNFTELRRLASAHQEAAASSELSPAQTEALMVVADSAPIMIKDLAARLHVSSGAVTQLTSVLEQNDLVERIRDEDDRRIVWVNLAQSGRDHIQRLKKQYFAPVQRLLNALDEAELIALHDIQQKLLNSYQQEEN